MAAVLDIFIHHMVTLHTVLVVLNAGSAVKADIEEVNAE